MHKNIIFDCGRVLKTWDQQYLMDIFIKKENQEIVDSVVFKDKWKMLDEGMSEDDFSKYIKDFLPPLAYEQFSNLLYNWIYYFKSIDRSFEIVKELKAKGHDVYILSNMPHLLPDNIEKFPEFNIFDGILFSSKVKMVKPNKEFYQLLIDKYNIDVSSSLFVDDNQDNIEGAKNIGIDSYLFDEKHIEDFYQYLKENNDL